MREIDHNDAQNISAWIGRAPVGVPVEIGSARARNLAAAHLAVLEAIDSLLPGWQTQGLEKRVKGANEWLAELMTEIGPTTTRFSDGTVLAVTRAERPDPRSNMPGLLEITRTMGDGTRVSSLYEWSAQNLPDGKRVLAPANGPHPPGEAQP